MSNRSLHHLFITRVLDLSVPIEQVNYLAGHKSMAMTKRYDHANEERYGAAIEALDAAGKTGSAGALAATSGPLVRDLLADVKTKCLLLRAK